MIRINGEPGQNYFVKKIKMHENDELRSLLPCVRYKIKKLKFRGKGHTDDLNDKKAFSKVWTWKNDYIADKISACDCQRREKRLENPTVREVGISL